jgi:hypothetical protein
MYLNAHFLSVQEVYSVLQVHESKFIPGLN